MLNNKINIKCEFSLKKKILIWKFGLDITNNFILIESQVLYILPFFHLILAKIEDDSNN